MADTPNTVPATVAAPDTSQLGSGNTLDTSVDPSKLGPTAGTPDNAAGAPQTPPQTTQQPQAASDGSNQPSDAQPGQQPQGGSASPAQPGATPAAQPTQVPKAVQHASIIHSIAQTLAGGPRTSYSIDANTGKMVATQTPLSGKSIAQAIAIAALSGGFAGLSEKGPGADLRAAGAGFNKVEEQQQQADASAKQQASQDYARQAAITQTNFQTHQNALRLSQMEYDYHKQIAGDTEPVLKNINAVGAGLESGVHESDLLAKYHVTKDMAIPDGTVENGKNPDGSTHWENTYTVIDPNKKIELPEDTAKLLADLRIPGYFTMKDGKSVPQDFSGSAGIRAGLVVNGLATAQGFQITEAQMNKQFAGLKDGDKYAAQFDVNLKKSIASGDVTLKGLQVIGNYAGLPLDQAVEAMRKDKVDPAIISQFERVVPADAMEQIKQKRLSSEATAKATDAKANLVVSKNNFDEVLADPKSYSPEQIVAAQKIDKQVRQEKQSDAYNEGAARLEGEIAVKKKNGIPLTSGGGTGTEADNLTHPELAETVMNGANYNTPNGTNEAFLNGMMKIDPERAKLIKAYSEGMDLQSYYAAVKKFGGSLAADIHAYDPSFNASKMREYDKVQTDFGPNGKLGLANKAASTTFKHLNNLHTSIGTGATAAVGLNGDYKEDLANSISEMGNAYANGHKAGEAELKDQREALGSSNPFVSKAATIKAAIDLMDKVQSDYQSYDDALPKGVKRQGLIDGAGADSFFHLTGKPVDVKLIKAPKAATGTAPDTTGKLWYHDAKGDALTPVPGR